MSKLEIPFFFDYIFQIKKYYPAQTNKFTIV